MISRIERHCLCVGLNYPGTSNELSGCVNDANDWAAALWCIGYKAAVLLEPTKAELVSALRDTLGTLRFADRFIFTYSGHGSWVPDMDGDEADRRDEVLCLKDDILTDDELAAIFGAARYGVRRTIISDSCHSGSVSRRRSQAPTTAKPRFLPPGEFLSGAALTRAVAVEGNPAKGTPRTGAVLISGCTDTEYSYDAWFANRANGAFTRAAIDTLGPTATMRQWHAAIRGVLPSSTYPQAPQLTACDHQRQWKL